MRYRISLFIILFLILQNVTAQVKGVIVDSAGNKPLDKAIIGLVIKAKLTDTIYTHAREKGEFSFETVPSSDFSIIVTHAGYHPVAKLIRIDTTVKTIDLGMIPLVNMAKVMEEVVIQNAPVTIKEDTIEYRADAFKVKEHSVVEDLLKKLPGVRVDKDGNIQAQGKTVTKVKVNGKDFFGGDPKTATKELPANIVDKVQIIDDYGEQATVSGIKDGEPEKVMNIQLKKDKNSGYFGRMTAGAGNQERYQAAFNGNYFKDKQQVSVIGGSNNNSQSLFNSGGGSTRGSMIRSGQDEVSTGDMLLLNAGSGSDGITTTNSIGVNYRDTRSKRVTVYGSYNYSDRNNSGDRILSQQNIFSNETFFNNQNNTFESLGYNHRFFFNIEYHIDSFNYLKISPGFSYSTNDRNSKTVFDYFKGNTKTSEGFYNTISKSHSPNFTGNILYNHKFRKRGRNFSVSLNAGTSENNSEQDSRNYTLQYFPASGTNLFLFNTQENSNYNYAVRFTYTEPLSKVKFLDVAFSHNLSYSRNNKVVYDVDPATSIKIFNNELSNDYENNYFNNRANISVRTSGKKYNYSLGISVHPVNIRGSSITKDSAYRPVDRVNVFPVARFTYRFSGTKSFNFSYRGDAQQPGFIQLQDVLDSSNRQYQRKGNPNLKPSINHGVNLSYNDFNIKTGRAFFTGLSVSQTQNRIVNNTVLLDNSGAVLITPENVNGYYNVTGFYNYSRPYNNRQFVISLNGVLNFNHNISLVNGMRNVGKNWGIGQGLNFEFNHKEWLELVIGSNYNLNSITFSNRPANTSFQNDEYSTWNITSNLMVDIPRNWIMRYDFEYIINQGLAGEVGKNVANLNASIEKQLFKNRNGIIRLQAFDLFDQNSNIIRTVTDNSIIDSRSSRLNRYFMISFSYRIQKFSGKEREEKTPGNIIRIGR